MAEDMDIDLVMEEEEDPEIAQMKAQAEANYERARIAEAELEAMNVVTDGPEEGEVDHTTIVPYKIHIRGLDTFTSDNIKAFLAEHFTAEQLKRIEWIDDTSANLIFESADVANEALEALSIDILSDPLQLRRAKQPSSHPNIELHLRQAIAGDVKQPGAKDRSRFYLLNPQYDPDVRAIKRRHGDNVHRTNKRRRFADLEEAMRRARTGPPITDNYYDEAPSETEADIQAKRAQMEDLFKNRKPEAIQTKTAIRDGRLRDRSSSPRREEDGRYGFNEEHPARRTARQRSLTPPHIRKARRRDRDMEDTNRDKELFPDKNNAAHKRSDAQYLHPDQVATIIVQDKPKPKGDLFSRITGKKNDGRLNASSDVEGFSILGAARAENPLVKELFPLKAAAAVEEKKDLFDGKIKGRAAQRRRAEF